MKAGPKASVDPSGLPWRPRSVGSARFARFCDRYVKVPKGTGARSPLRLRPWQRDLVGSVLDTDPQPRTAGWMLPRGQGKSSLVGAWGLYELFTGGEGPRCAWSPSMSVRPASCSGSLGAWWNSTSSWSRGCRCSRNGW